MCQRDNEDTLIKNNKSGALEYIRLTEEELKQIIKCEVGEAMEAYKKEQEEIWRERAEHIRDNAKLLIVNYRKFKKMKDTSVYDTDTVRSPTLRELFENMLEQVRKDEFTLTSTKRNKIITGMLMNHIDVQLDNYKKECEMSDIPDINRRYRVIEMMYLREKPMKAEEVAELECIDKSNVYRTLERAYDDLTIYFFGVEGLDVLKLRKKKRKNKQNVRKSCT